MKWKILIVVVIVILAVGVMAEHAVTKTQIRPIREISANGARGAIVAISGRVAYAADNQFVVDDGTGRAELATCPTWYRRIDLSEGDRTVVIGQVMASQPLREECRFTLSVYKIDQPGGTIELRRGPGIAPWFSDKHARTASVR